ncbi:MAG: hypothetical protein MOGMAGMI_01524 [Candidatus Omnitrophica bacterium]|nr:hypothetical protein [Candidatus Omnitrophota bacterium]
MFYVQNFSLLYPVLKDVADVTCYTANPHALPVFFTLAATLILGIYVLLRERHSAVSVAFFLMTLPAAIWLFAFGMMLCSERQAVAHVWARAEYLGVPFIPAAVLHFTLRVLGHYQAHRRKVLAAFFAAAAFAPVAIFSKLILSGVSLRPYGYYPEYAAGALPFLLFFGAVMVVSLMLFVRESRRSQPSVHRSRIRCLLAAFLIADVAMVDYLAKFGLPVYPFGYACIFVFALVSAVAVTRYRLVDITPSFAAESIIGTMSEAVLVSDTEGIVRLANDACCDLFKMDRMELIGSALALVAPVLEKPVETTVAGEHIEVRHELADGRERDLSVKESVIRDSLGRLVARVLVLRDVTALRSAERALKEAREHLSGLYREMPEAVVVLDEYGRFSMVNPSAERLLGCEGRTLSGRIFVMSTFLAPATVPRMLQMIRNVMQGMEEPAIPFELAAEDGVRIPLEAYPSAVRHDGRIAGVQLILRHPKDQLSWADAMRRARQEVLESVRGKLEELFKDDAKAVEKIRRLEF